MKHLFKAFVLAMILTLFVRNMVYADDYVSTAVDALKNTTVYVAPGIPGTDVDTAGKLQKLLQSDDNIVLVMLPMEAGSGTDIYTIAKSLSDQLGNQYIIGLSVGRNVIGFAPSMPSGVAADKMERADSVSNDPVTALITFVQNIHKWQANTQPTATPEPTPIPSDEDEKSGWLLWVLIPVGVILAGVFIFGRIVLQNAGGTERTNFSAPDQVRGLLSKIVKDRDNIRDEELRHILYQMCVDIEKYFKSSSNDKDKDALFFKERLTEVNDILIKYIDVQENTRYYHDPAGLLLRGKQSIVDFSIYVLESIKRGNSANLMKFKVNTNILQAQRYS